MRTGQGRALARERSSVCVRGWLCRPHHFVNGFRNFRKFQLFFSALPLLAYSLEKSVLISDSSVCFRTRNSRTCMRISPYLRTRSARFNARQVQKVLSLLNKHILHSCRRPSTICQSPMNSFWTGQIIEQSISCFNERLLFNKISVFYLTWVGAGQMVRLRWCTRPFFCSLCFLRLFCFCLSEKKVFKYVFVHQIVGESLLTCIFSA